MMRAATIVITVADDPTLRCRLAVTAAFDQAFIDALKAAVPGPDRWWEPAGNTWHVAEKHQAAICDLAKRLYADARLVEDGGERWTDLHSGRIFQQLRLW